MKKLFGGMFLAVLLFNLTLYAAIGWGLGSLITSGIKVGTDRCGQVLQIEETFSLAGNLFCGKE